MKARTEPMAREALISQARRLYPNARLRMRYLRSVLFLRRSSGWVLEGGKPHYERGRVRCREGRP